MTDLPASRVEIVLIDSAACALSEHRFSLRLAETERNRAAGYRFGADRRRFVIGRAALRASIGRLLEVDPASLRFTYGPNGKPAMATDAVRFSVSHSADVVGLALADGDVGLDVQCRVALDARGLASEFLCQEETSRVLGAADPIAAFLAIWTGKEAVVKAASAGLSLSLRSFVVPALCDALQPIRLLAAVKGLQGLQVARVFVAPDYHAAIAVRAAGPMSITTRWESPERILEALEATSGEQPRSRG
jgi:4'-phosphopantetheinyl transferase